jgi:putative transcriptional regulator
MTTKNLIRMTAELLEMAEAQHLLGIMDEESYR